MADLKDNMAIWQQVCETDVKATKPGKVNGQNITTINGTSVVKKATEVFGPIGTGWGYEIVEESFKDGAPAYSIVKEQPVLQGHEVMHTIRIKVWYKQGETTHSVEHYGHTPYILATKYGLKTDFDAPKKSLTDALKKALSMLGFNADIFLGQFDDVNYVNAQIEKQSIEQAENQADAMTEAVQKFEVDLASQVKLFDTAQSAATLKAMTTAAISKFERRSANMGRDPLRVRDYLNEEARKAGQKFIKKEKTE